MRLFRHAERGAVIGRHDHHHRGAGVLGLAAALGADREPKCVVVTITGTRPATCSSTACITRLALGIGQHELLGEIGEDAQAVASRRRS